MANKTFNILVIGGVASYNWKELFKNETHNGVSIRIERVHWDEISLTSFHDSGVQLTLVPKQQSKNATTQEPIASYKPDFIIFRSAGRGIYGQDFRNVLYGLQHANVPSLNSLDSIYFCQEKPIIYGKLNTLRKKLGDERFPLIPQTYYGSWKAMSFHTDLPVVVKFGTCHSGFGKMRITTDSDFEDIRSIVALQPHYVTAEPFIDWDYDIRIQKIGHHYRAFRRTSANWKGWFFSDPQIHFEGPLYVTFPSSLNLLSNFR
jgi:synapsin